MSNILSPGLMPDSLTGIQAAFNAGDASSKADFQAAVSVYGSTGGGNLLVNGCAELGTNANFTAYLLDGVYVQQGGSKSFALPHPSQDVIAMIGDRMIPVAANNLLQFSCVMLSGEIDGTLHNGTKGQYYFVNCFDGDGLQIRDWMANPFVGAANTTLATTLVNGATQIVLTSAAGWQNGGGASQRQIAWWPMQPAGVHGYTEASGRVHLPYTYSRNVAQNTASGLWPAGGISGNTITLTSPWSGGTVAAGVPVMNTNGGGGLLYFRIANANLGENNVSGKFTSDTSKTADVYLYKGTSQIKVAGLYNSGGTGTPSKIRIGSCLLRYI